MKVKTQEVLFSAWSNNLLSLFIPKAKTTCNCHVTFVHSLFDTFLMPCVHVLISLSNMTNFSPNQNPLVFNVYSVDSQFIQSHVTKYEQNESK